MREWGRFTEESIGEFDTTHAALVEYLDTAVDCENVVRSLAAGLVYFNGGEDYNGAPLLALPSPPDGAQLTQNEWTKVITYITNE